ncbi:hypothetical protein GCM10027048_12860 [Hymenobacter coalescens]
MKRLTYLLSALWLGLLSSCTDVVPIDLPEPEPQLAVEGTITDQPGPYTIRLTRTGAYFTDQELPAVRGAELTLADNEGHTETLRETAPGVYQTSSLQGKIGNHYVLTIKAEGEEYRAETEIKRTPRIDGLVQQRKTGEPGWDDGYYALYNGPELSGVGDYYRFKVFLNGELQNKPDDLIVQSDEMVDGKYIGNIELHGDPLQPGDSVRVQLLAIPQDYYYFLSEMYTQINNVGLFSAPPANVRSNVVNQNPTGRKAVGYFAGTAVRSARLTIQP